MAAKPEEVRYNDFNNDPLAEVEGCDEKRVPAGAIANRLDLSDINATCTFSDIDWMVGSFSPYGALDAKVANVDSFPSLEFTAVAGPPHGNLKPFKWSDFPQEYLERNHIESFPIPKFNIQKTHNKYKYCLDTAKTEIPIAYTKREQQIELHI